MRQMQHPGPALEPRILVEQSRAVPELRVRLPIGADLLVGIGHALVACGVLSAGIRLAGGILAQCRFVTGIPDPTGFRIATHSPANELAGPVLLICGGAVLGIDEAGCSHVHCHALFAAQNPSGQAAEVRSGHLVPGACPVAGSGLEVWVTPTGDARFESRFDEETNFPLMHPGRCP